MDKLNENEQEFHEILKRNICLKCKGKGRLGENINIGEICFICFGSGKRFQNQLKDGILED